MASRFSPPVLYLTDDDDDNETEQNISYGSSLSSINNNNLPRKKRKLTNTNVRVNPSVVNWSKRQRIDHYQPQQITHNSMQYEPEPMVIDINEYNFGNQQSHSFHAFDWTTEQQTSPPTPRIYSNPIQTTSRVSIVPRPNVMNVVKHHLDQQDTISLMPLTHQNDIYVQHAQRKSRNISISATSPPPPPLPLPLPTPTSSFIRPQTQRIQSGKTIRIPYTHSTPAPAPAPRPPPPPPPPPSLPIHHHPIKQVFQPPKYRSPSPASISTPISTPEIRRQALNGTGILSAFYDSKCYRCNICKFKSLTSSTLLQHLFTHIFFCSECSFYSYSHHNLYQHIFEKHNTNHKKDDINPKNLDLLYITRCADGTFALCMDTSTPPPPPPAPAPPPLPTATRINEIKSSNTNIKPKITKKKAPPKQKKEQDNDIVILSEKRNINPPQSSSSVITKHPIPKEKQANTYVLMKHRRCYSTHSPPCLHSLSLEYNICREHTIRHMCHTHKVLKRRKFKPKSNTLISIEAAECLKTIVNQVVNNEENRDSYDLVCTLPNNILNLIFQNDDLHTITNLLKLNNKYDKSLEQNEQNQSEYLVRTSNQHVFILSSSDMNKNEQSIFASLQTSITNADSIFTHTKLDKLPISYDNTNRFLKGNLNIQPQPTNSTTKSSKKNDTNQRPVQSKIPELIPPVIPKPSGSINHSSSSSPILARTNHSVTSSNSSLCSSPGFIVID